MKVTWKALVALVLAVIAVAWVVTLYSETNESVRRYPINVGSFSKTGNYKIDPKTIVEAVALNDTNIFQPEQEMALTPIPNLIVSWNQATYQSIARAVYQAVWQESQASWSLSRMEFHTGCSDGLEGFDWGDFTYFKDIRVNGENMYSAREIQITPEHGDISWGSDTNFPRPLLGWERIDLNRVRVSAEEALRTADTKGGKDIRLSMQNRCQIYVSMYPEAYGYNDWKVSYSGSSYMDFRVPSE